MPDSEPLDATTQAAMARWPDVPECYGWLRLDARGRWLVDGRPAAHAGLREFIGRNYRADEHGRWYFQNGPQRVFVGLDAAPWVLALLPDAQLQTHTGRQVGAVTAAWLASDGQLYLQTDLGPAVVGGASLAAATQYLRDGHGRVLDEAAVQTLLEGDAVPGACCVLPAGRVSLRPLDQHRVEAETGFVREPTAAAH